MSEYKEMYLKLFDSQTKAIEILQQAQQEAEKMFMEAHAENPQSASIQEKLKNPEN